MMQASPARSAQDAHLSAFRCIVVDSDVICGHVVVIPAICALKVLIHGVSAGAHLAQSVNGVIRLRIRVGE